MGKKAIKTISLYDDVSSEQFLQELITLSKTLTFEINEHKKQSFNRITPYKYYFRGTTKYDYKLISTMLREYEKDFQHLSSWEDLHKLITRYIENLIQYYNDFCEKYKTDIEAIESIYPEDISLKLITQLETHDKNIFALMQHYSSQTPLIDLTSNFFIALFFAVNQSSANKYKDGALWLINREFYFAHYNSWYLPDPEMAIQLLKADISSETVHNYISVIRELQSFTSTTFKDEQEDFQKIKNDPDYIFKLMDNMKRLFETSLKKAHSVIEENLYDGGLNERLCRQQGLFILQSFLPVCITKEIYNPKLSCPTPFIKIRIPAKHKKYISDFLDRVMGINEKSLFLKRDTAEEPVHEQT